MKLAGFTLIAAALAAMTTGSTFAGDGFISQIGTGGANVSVSVPQVGVHVPQLDLSVPSSGASHTVGLSGLGLSVSLPDPTATMPDAASLMAAFGTWLPERDPTRNIADTIQSGTGNNSLIDQSGGLGNAGLVSQTGDMNMAAIAQNGSMNAAGIYQSASMGTATIHQQGSGNSALIIQH